MSDDQLTRRQFVRRSLTLGAVAAAGGALVTLGAGCGSGELTCTETGALSPQEAAMRQQLQYADRTPDPSKTCSNCRFFTAAAAANTCGSCSLVKGPINPQGHCTSWAAKA